ncbi:MAG: type II secretion system protein GspM [Gemmatimonadales bacterium]
MNFSPSERRTILRGALVLAPFALYLGAVRPYLAALSDVRDRIEVASQALARERAAVDMAKRNPEVQRLTDSAAHAAAPRLFAGRDDVMASAELAAYLGELADRHKVWMQDATTRPGVTSPAGVRTLRVEIRAESDFEGLLEFLQALEQGRKLVRVDRLEVSQALSSPGNEDAETLTIVASISGFALPDSSTTAPVRPDVARRP